MRIDEPTLRLNYRQIGLLEHVGYGNLGDDATVAAVKHHINLRWNEAQIVAITLHPHDTQKRHGITSYPIRRDCKALISRVVPQNKLKTALRNYPVLTSILRIVKAVAIRAPLAIFQETVFLVKSLRITKSLDLLVICGGGQLRDASVGPYKFPYSIFKWVALAKVTGTRCYFVNLGAGPLKSFRSRFLFKYALALSDYISFRDIKSQLLIQETGFTGTSRVHADCVYGLPLPEACLCRHASSDAPPVVGISPMQVFWDKDPKVYAHLIGELGRFGAWLARRQHCLQLFSTEVWSDYQPIGDLKAAIQHEFGSPSITCPSIDGITSLLTGMAAMDYIVTCRFHGVVFAHLLNIPVLAIAHHPKVATMMNDIGLSDYCLDINTFNFDQLTETFNRLVANKADIKARMAERAGHYRRELTVQFDSLFRPSTSGRPQGVGTVSA